MTLKPIRTFESTDLEYIAAELFDPQKPGAISLPEAIPPNWRVALLQEIRKAPHTPSPGVYDHAREELSHYFPNPLSLFPTAADLAHQHFRFYNCLGNIASFDRTPTKPEVCFHYFHQGSIGITPHYDYSRYINMFAVYILEGQAAFGVCADRQKNGAIELDSRPGSIILLRSPRKPEEKTMRPMHYVGEVHATRRTIVIRHEALRTRSTDNIPSP